VAGEIISITGITTFTATSLTVLASPSATTFVLSSVTTGTAVSGQTGTIVGFVYYTTSAAHGLTGTIPPNEFLTITGVTGVTGFNVARGTIVKIPTTTVFVLASSVTGAVTSQTGVIVFTRLTNTNNTLTGLARVQGLQPQRSNNPKNLSALSWGGTTSSSKFQQPGGLPANGKVGNNYTRLPQNAGWIQGGAGNLSSGPKRF
jgi:hypothetical protein